VEGKENPILNIKKRSHIEPCGKKIRFIYVERSIGSMVVLLKND